VASWNEDLRGRVPCEGRDMQIEFWAGRRHGEADVV